MKYFILQYKINAFYFNTLQNIIYSFDAKSKILLQSSMSHNPSEMINIYWFAAQVTFLHIFREHFSLDSLMNRKFKRTAFIGNTFFLRSSPSPLPSASLARQWSLSCCNTALQPSLWREEIMLCFSMSQYMLAFMVPSMNCSSSVPAALMQPQTMTLPPPCLTVGKTHLSLYSSPGFRHTLLTPSEPNKFILVLVPVVCQDYFQVMVPVVHVLSLLQQNVCRLSCASSLEEASFWDDSHADQFDAVCGVWPEHWQADPPPLQPLQQCWQHSYVYFPNTTSGHDAEHVHSTSWLTMAMPVLSGTCPVKPLNGLGHHDAAQFQGLGNLLIAYAIFM